jgi:hypothetical protein
MGLTMNSKLHTILTTGIFSSLLLLSSPSKSQLYEAQGQALIQNNNTEQARTQAMENALKKALLVAGASVSSVQQVVNGLLTQDEISIRASGNVNAIELIDEIYADNTITVTIRADIFPQESQCFSADFRKSLLLTKSYLKHRQQANIGEIYAIDSAPIEKLSSLIKKNSHYVDIKSSTKHTTAFSRYNKSIQIEQIKQLSMTLADNTDSHYVLYSEIDDVSFNGEATNKWQFWQRHVFDRNFAISIYLYNGSNGEAIFQKTYQNFAPWEFNKREQVDINSHNFWQSKYGKMVTTTLDSVVKDIDENIMCETTRAKIVQVNNNTIKFNLGSMHGVKVGDEFTLLHKNNFISDAGTTYAGYNVSAYKVKVIQVSKQSATAKTPDDGLLGNIQINDYAVRY